MKVQKANPREMSGGEVGGWKSDRKRKWMRAERRQIGKGGMMHALKSLVSICLTKASSSGYCGQRHCRGICGEYEFAALMRPSPELTLY